MMFPWAHVRKERTRVDWRTRDYHFAQSIQVPLSSRARYSRCTPFFYLGIALWSPFEGFPQHSVASGIYMGRGSGVYDPGLYTVCNSGSLKCRKQKHLNNKLTMRRITQEK